MTESENKGTVEPSDEDYNIFTMLVYIEEVFDKLVLQEDVELEFIEVAYSCLLKLRARAAVCSGAVIPCSYCGEDVWDYYPNPHVDTDSIMCKEQIR